jgi:hypothetical protein
MKRTLACLTIAFIFGLGTLARAAADDNSCCKHCCKDKCGQTCCKDGCTDSCCKGK